MASTPRKPTAQFRSENSPNIFPTPDLKHSIGGGPDLFTIPHPSGQGISPSRLFVHEPQLSWIGNAASIAYEAHRRANGSTVSIFDGSMVGKKFYAVSIFPARTVELTTPPDWRQLFAFGLQNADLLLTPGFALGTCFDKSRHIHELDVVLCVSDRQVTMELGRLFKQRSVFDLAAQLETPVEAHHAHA